MSKATSVAISKGLLSADSLSEVYQSGDNRIIWHDQYFLHLLEVLESDEVIYQSRPLSDSWMFEDV